MYFRVIRNRGRKRNIPIRKILIILLVGLLAHIVINIGVNEVKVGNVKNKVVYRVKEVAYNICKFAVRKEYSIETYKFTVDNPVEVTDFVNFNSNLYTYLEEEKNIQVTLRDPSYNYVDKEDTILTDTDVDNDLNTKVVESNDGNAKEEVDVNTQSNKETEAVYVPPKVAENGIRYTMSQLSSFEFLMNKLYIVPSRAKVLEEELNAEEMLAKDMALKQDNTKPQILIYHTHSQEGFADSVKGKPETYIVGVGDYLTKLLSEEYGYNVIHCKEQFDIKSGKLDRSKAYTYAEETITQILEDNPSIEVVIDLHRDGLKEGAEKLVTTVDGKEVAKIMFFNGVSRSSTSGDIDYLYNRYKKDNLAFSFQLKLAAMECFPDYTRKNYIDAYQYNQHLRAKSVLIEAGAQNNTLQEELNSMEVLAEILHRVIK